MVYSFSSSSKKFKKGGISIVFPYFLSMGLAFVCAGTLNHDYQTKISIIDGKWHINDDVTYQGAKAEGLLMNVRMVNAVFEDAHRPDFDPEENTDKFIVQIPDYTAYGVRAFTLSLQGGMPGYEGAVNSAFRGDGSLRKSYLARVKRVIEACDNAGVAVILCCYYQRQDQILKDVKALRRGVVNVANWIRDCGFTNVMMEIANEYGHGGFNHLLLKTDENIAELIELAHETVPGLLVSASGGGSGKAGNPVAEAADFVLIHFNNTPIKDIPARIAEMKRFGKPVVCNEDDKVGELGARAAEVCVAHGCSWGLMAKDVNQYFPLEFKGHQDDRGVYAKLKELTTRR